MLFEPADRFRPTPATTPVHPAAYSWWAETRAAAPLSDTWRARNPRTRWGGGRHHPFRLPLEWSSPNLRIHPPYSKVTVVIVLPGSETEGLNERKAQQQAM